MSRFPCAPVPGSEGKEPSLTMKNRLFAVVRPEAQSWIQEAEPPVYSRKGKEGRGGGRKSKVTWLCPV